jgi:hypothetical protein
VADDARAVNAGLARLGPLGLARALGLPFRKEGPRVWVRCPWHDDRDPSASLSMGPAGTVRLHCFPCDRTGDALSLVAHTRGLSVEHDFVEVLVEGARVAGLLLLEAELCEREGLGRRPPPKLAPPPAVLPPERPRDYPSAGEVTGLWASARPLVDYRVDGPDSTEAVVADPGAYEMLESRGLSPEAVTALDLARALSPGAVLPRWARYRGELPASRPWPELGYRLVLPVYDHRGTMRSVRAWRVEGGDGPKRVPPSGCRADGLVLACPFARRMLAGDAKPERVLVVEGEPDFLTVATRFSDADESAPAVLGVVSGAWSADVAARVPNGALVGVWTHADRSGDGYARQVAETLAGRCAVRRGRLARREAA